MQIKRPDFEFLKSKTYVVLIVGVILLIISGTAYVYLSSKPQTKSNLQEQVSDSMQQGEKDNNVNQNQSQESSANKNLSASTLPSESKPNEWKTYQNTKYNFKIDIPINMDALWENPNGYQINFGYAEKKKIVGGYDGEWAILIYNKSQTSSEKVIAKMGDQFGATRKEKRENITINGVPAIEVIITTSEYPDWYYKSAVIENKENIYEIGNGAIKNDLFEDFYKSFRLDSSIQPYEIYDMANIDRYTDGCEGKTMPAPQEKKAAVKKLYNDLSKNNYSDAISIATDNTTFEYGLFTYLFPRCSGGETVMAANVQQNGIALLTFTGRKGEASGAFLGFLTVSSNKIIYYREQVKDYFDSTEFKLDDKTKKEFESGTFANKDLQKDYDQFLSKL